MTPPSRPEREPLITALFALTPAIRYVAIADGQNVESQVRPRLEGGSEPESDRYEELLVNPTLLTLTRQRGDIDCGGLRFVLVGYGNFHQLVLPYGSGHASIAFELDGDPLAWVGEIRTLLERHQ